MSLTTLAEKAAADRDQLVEHMRDLAELFEGATLGVEWALVDAAAIAPEQRRRLLLEAMHLSAALAEHMMQAQEDAEDEAADRAGGATLAAALGSKVRGYGAPKEG